MNIFKCPDEKVGQSPNCDGSWCSAKLVCGGCVSTNLDFNNYGSVCRRRAIKGYVNCDICRNRFSCWTCRHEST